MPSVYNNLIEYIRGMYEESGAKEGGWSDDEILTDLMRFDQMTLVNAEQELSMFGPELSRNMGYYNLEPQDKEEWGAVPEVAQELAK